MERRNLLFVCLPFLFHKMVWAAASYLLNRGTVHRGNSLKLVRLEKV